MPRVTPQELERLRLRVERAEARLKQAKQQQRYQDRKNETRSKIITGGAFAAAVRDGAVSQSLLAYVLGRYVTNAKDRAFLGLEPLEETTTTEPAAQDVSTQSDADEVPADNSGGQLLSDVDLEDAGTVDDAERN